MEVLSSFGPNVASRTTGWYEVKSLTKGPYPRGGHSGLYVRSCGQTDDDEKDKVFIIGGADPDRAFDQTYILNFKTMTWDCCTSEKFSARYEHSCYIPASYPDKIYVFGGADLQGNRNDVQVLDVKSDTWETIEVDGNQPCPRTQHHSAAFGDYLVVFGGGDCGANPVSDSDVHIFNATTQSWSILTTTGTPPSIRHGHAMVSCDSKIYVHGGMSGSTFYDDIYSLDMETCTWNKLLPNGRKPSARAAHGAVVINKQIFFFGGLCSKGALNDLHKFEIGNQNWIRINIPGQLPLPRLDFAICAIEIEPVKSNGHISTGGSHQKITQAERRRPPSWLSKTISLTRNDMGFFSCWCFSGIQSNPSGHTETPSPTGNRHAIFIHGGMDTEGNIFDDFFIYLV